MTSNAARAVVNHVADRIVQLPFIGPRVAVDGPDGAGKTHFADLLAGVLQGRQSPVVRVSVDDFHNVRAVRYRQGRQSPKGFWEDSYNYSRFRTDVLEPFGPGGSRRFRRACYSHDTDEIIHPSFETADPAAILIVDGIFLQRAALSALWHLTVFLDVEFTETARRMALRDGTSPDPDDPSMRRYVQGQREYFRESNPHDRATILIDNNNVRGPRVLRE
ncbi:uridine kinase [Mycobacterium sp. 21AC1]|uniref:uridine kinase n=1 Tax=[Mycobacterium] appelbergii TaxID=2939269 RepID=UPI0029394D42|nr:uridine kinase [Mycobacterium sp. 21AC1]MDV3125854.1 uridine kinase [Mycobacterium sp. 21AC1]